MTNLGARGALEIMNSMGGLKSITKGINAGDRVALIFPVSGTDEEGNPIITVAHRRGHSVDLGDGYKRSFIPTKSVLKPTGEVVEPDFAFSIAPIFRAIFESDKARKIKDIEDSAPNETAKKIELENLEKLYKNKYPELSGLQLRVYSEVAMYKIDANGNIIGNTSSPDYGSLQISKKKLQMLIAEAEKNGAYVAGDNYVYITMQTTAGADRNQMTQVSWHAITDVDKKLETKHPEVRKVLTDLFKQKSPTPDTIGAKIYDFKEYDEAELKTAVTNFVADREYMLRKKDGSFNDAALTARNVEALTKLGLVATADQINALINNATGGNAEAQPEQNKADMFNKQFAEQTADMSETAPFEGQQEPNQEQQAGQTGAVHGTMQI